MPLRLALMAAFCATAAPAIAQSVPLGTGAAPEVIWVDSIAEIPGPTGPACIGNLSAIYCQGEDGQTYAILTPIAPAPVPETVGHAIAPGQNRIGVQIDGAVIGTPVDAQGLVDQMPPHGPSGTPYCCMPRIP